VLNALLEYARSGGGGTQLGPQQGRQQPHLLNPYPRATPRTFPRPHTWGTEGGGGGSNGWRSPLLKWGGRGCHAPAHTSAHQDGLRAQAWDEGLEGGVGEDDLHTFGGRGQVQHFLAKPRNSGRSAKRVARQAASL